MFIGGLVPLATEWWGGGCNSSHDHGGCRIQAGRNEASPPPIPDTEARISLFLLGQVVGTLLRIPQVSSANSGEYVCRVSSAAVTQEAVLVVTIQDSDSVSRRESWPPLPGAGGCGATPCQGHSC